MIPASTDEDPPVSIAAAADFLQITAERVRQLQRGGFVPREGRGKTRLRAAVRGYIRFLREAGRAAAGRGIRRGRERAAHDLSAEAIEAALNADPPPAPKIVEHACRSCGGAFERPAQGGRAPFQCSACPPYRSPAKAAEARFCGCGAALTGKRRFCAPCGAARERERLRLREQRRPPRHRDSRRSTGDGASCFDPADQV